MKRGGAKKRLKNRTIHSSAPCNNTTRRASSLVERCPEEASVRGPIPRLGTRKNFSQGSFYNSYLVDLARIGLAPQQCECCVIPLYYRPVSSSIADPERSCNKRPYSEQLEQKCAELPLVVPDQIARNQIIRFLLHTKSVIEK